MATYQDNMLKLCYYCVFRRCTDSAQLLYKDRDVWLKRCHSTRDSLELTKAELQRRDEEVLVLKNQLRLSGIASENLKLEVAGLGDRATRLQQTLDGEVALRKDYESRATQLNSVIEEANRLRAEVRLIACIDKLLLQ